jgi:ankyrin repeat protein
VKWLSEGWYICHNKQMQLWHVTFATTALQGAAIQGHIKIALMLLDAGVEVNAEPAAIEGRTALDGAAEHGRLDMVQLLLNLGAESDEPGATRFDNAIRLAEEYNHSAIIDLLKDASGKDGLKG